RREKMSNAITLDRNRAEGLLVMSLYLGDIRNLSNEQLLQKAWEKIQDRYFNIFSLHRYNMCRTAF
ncbi:1586_t:CDS:1, partial [Racocetra persica]